MNVRSALLNVIFIVMLFSWDADTDSRKQFATGHDSLAEHWPLELAAELYRPDHFEFGQVAGNRDSRQAYAMTEQASVQPARTPIQSPDIVDRNAMTAAVEREPAGLRSSTHREPISRVISLKY